MIFELVRFSDPKELQLGVLKINGEPAYTTAEPLWKENKVGISCIPIGEYPIQRHHSDKFKTDVWLVLDVPGRTNILMHPGNLPKDTQGCIMVGTGFAKISGIRTISNSVIGFSNFMKETRGIEKGVLYISEERYE